jgi:NAD-dependent dihydropyrimidine dehydrogenase PreA subunit
MIQSAVSNTLRYNAKLCINCGLCSIVCPHGVFAPSAREGRVARAIALSPRPARLAKPGRTAEIVAAGDGVAQLVRPEACMECGACQRNCPSGAIHVQSGVGCAAALMRVALTGKGEETCGCGDDKACCS